MKAHYEFTQDSEAWHRMRYRRIGGTLAGGLMVESDTLMIHLLSEFSEEFQMEDEGYISPDMMRGIELQPEALRRLNDYLSGRGVELKECGYLESLSNHLLGFSPDGISECEKFMCEIKCPAKKKHTETIYYKAIAPTFCGIPLDNLRQCVYAFAVNPKLEEMIFLSFRPEAKKSMFVESIRRETVVNSNTDAKPKYLSAQGIVDFMLLNAEKLKQKLQTAIEITNL